MIRSSRVRWAGHVALRENKNAYRSLVGKPEGDIPLCCGRIIHVLTWILGWGSMDWIHLA
jgi:hypothetical protein